MRQYDRLLVNLEKAEILQNGKIVPLTKSIDSTLENDISSGIEYICRFSDCKYIKTLFAEELKAPALEDEKEWNDSEYNKDKKYTGMSTYEIITTVTKAIGVSYYDDERTNDITEQKYLSYTTKDYYNQDAIFPLEITGYDRVVRVYGESYGSPAPSSGEYISIDPDTSRLTLHMGSGSEIYSLSGLDMSLLDRYDNIINNELPQDVLTWNMTSGATEIRLMLQSYGLRNPKYTGNGTEYYNISGYGLIREKK